MISSWSLCTTCQVEVSPLCARDGLLTVRAGPCVDVLYSREKVRQGLNFSLTLFFHSSHICYIHFSCVQPGATLSMPSRRNYQNPTLNVAKESSSWLSFCLEMCYEGVWLDFTFLLYFIRTIIHRIGWITGITPLLLSSCIRSHYWNNSILRSDLTSVIRFEEGVFVSVQ